MKKKKKKQAITLIEVMIVILLIGLIGGALAFNMRGSMDKGRQFKSDQAAVRIKDILELELAEGKSEESLKKEWQGIIEKHPLGNKKLLTDGWNQPFEIVFNGDGIVTVKSPHTSTEKNGA